LFRQLSQETLTFNFLIKLSLHQEAFYCHYFALWGHLAPQGELTLNMLRGSILNPKVSALTQLNGHFDFNQTPIVPPDIQVLVHVKSANRTT
jgi:hypothetical protein